MAHARQKNRFASAGQLDAVKPGALSLNPVVDVLQRAVQAPDAALDAVNPAEGANPALAAIELENLQIDVEGLAASERRIEGRADALAALTGLDERKIGFEISGLVRRNREDLVRHARPGPALLFEVEAPVANARGLVGQLENLAGALELGLGAHAGADVGQHHRQLAAIGLVDTDLRVEASLPVGGEQDQAGACRGWHRDRTPQQALALGGQVVQQLAADQRFHAQQVAAAAVGLQHFGLPVQGQQAHRRGLVQIDIALQAVGKLVLRLLQRFVLLRQLLLMDLQLVQQPAGAVFGHGTQCSRPSRQGVRRLRRMSQTRVRVAHRRSLSRASARLNRSPSGSKPKMLDPLRKEFFRLYRINQPNPSDSDHITHPQACAADPRAAWPQ